MAYRRVYRKRRFVPKRRPFRRRMRRTKVPPNLSNKTHFFKQTAELANVQVAAGAAKYFAYTFKLSDLGNSTAFAILFDQYRVNAVRITFYPQYNVYNAATSTIAVPEIYTAIDYNSAVVPSSVSEVDQYTTVKRQMFTRPHSRYLKPKVLYSIQDQGLTAAYANGPKPWLEIASPDVPHFAIIGAITASQSSSIVPQLVRVTVTYYVSFRSVR